MHLPIFPALALVFAAGGLVAAEQGGDHPGPRGGATPEARDAYLKAHDPELFKQADTNGDGVLDEQERAGLRTLMADKAFARFDTDHDGFVSKAEFAAGVEAMGKELKDRRDAKDGAEAKGGDDEAKGDDAEEGGRKAPNPEMRAKMLDRRFDRADANHDGKLDRAEFGEAMPAPGKAGGRRGGPHGGAPKDGDAGGDKPDDGDK